MCGIVGAVAHTPVNQLLYDALLFSHHHMLHSFNIVLGMEFPLQLLER